jgi:hypothetical protein
MNKSIVISTIILSIFWIISCSEENNPVTTGSDPVISRVNMKDYWDTQSSGLYKTEVWVNDPQGIGNLAGVYMTVHESSGGEEIFADSLYDDGAHFYPEGGDVLAGDGVYSNRFRAVDISRNSNQTEFIFQFIAFDKQNHESQIEENSVTFSPNSPPVIHQIFAPDSLSFRDENTIFSITVSDSDGIENITRAYFESKNLTKGYTLFEQELYNNGDIENHGDLIAGDSIFSTRIMTEFLAGKKGQYELIFHVEDSNEEQNMNEAKHLIYIENFKSEFVAFNIPEVMSIPTGPGDPNRELITVEVSDTEGLADIDSVYFFSMKPDSTLAFSGQPLILVDNGLPYNRGGNIFIETGDETAGDGIYSLSIFAENTSLPGVYIFSFFIRDKTGNLTGPVERTLELID